MNENCKINLEMLGLTQKQFQDRVVETVSENLMSEMVMDPDGEWAGDSVFGRAAKDYINTEIDNRVRQFCELKVGPEIAGKVDELTFPQTNAYGDKKKEPLSFREMVLAKAEHYLYERVDYNGRKNGSGKVTRLIYMIDKHLDYTLGTAVKDAMQKSDNVLSNAIVEAVKLALKDVTGKINVQIKRSK